MNLKYLMLGVLCAATACTSTPRVSVAVSNPLESVRQMEVVEIPLSELRAALDAPFYYVTDASGKEQLSQITSDSMFIFLATVPAGKTEVYRINPSDTMHVYAPVAVGRVHPERDDDLAWENDLCGFRAYGPAIQRKGERLYGYDIFFKHENRTPVLDTLYASQCSGENWRKVDSIRLTESDAAAQAFYDTFTYHLDHGLGYDCYAVGPTLGAGTAALYVNDSIAMPWCYSTVNVTDNGPIRFAADLEFAPVLLPDGSEVTERRRIILDAGSRLNRCIVTYDGLKADSMTVVTGFPRRDDFGAILDADGRLAYGDPTQGPDNGRALLGVARPEGFDSVAEKHGHVLGFTTLPAGEPYEYYWGFSWDRGPVADLEQWNSWLEDFNTRRRQPLEVTVLP